jgi:hypothetical protein
MMPASQLPENQADAQLVLRMAMEFVTNFLADDGPTKKLPPLSP